MAMEVGSLFISSFQIRPGVWKSGGAAGWGVDDRRRAAVEAAGRKRAQRRPWRRRVRDCTATGASTTARQRRVDDGRATARPQQGSAATYGGSPGAPTVLTPVRRVEPKRRGALEEQVFAIVDVSVREFLLLLMVLQTGADADLPPAAWVRRRGDALAVDDKGSRARACATRASRFQSNATYGNRLHGRLHADVK
ncbi:hypothetical protein EJB05_40565, partial [Eragrostis curvula]